MTGRVLYWNAVKHFGWVRPDHGPKDFFVHVADLHDVLDLHRGQQVAFDPIQTERGPRAVNVKVLEPAASAEPRRG